MNDQVKVLLITDGKAGHNSNSSGVLKALEKVTPLTHVTLQCRLRIKFLRYPLRWLLNNGLPLRCKSEARQRFVLRLFYVIDKPELIRKGVMYDWVISAGGDTSFLNAWLAHLLKAKNIFSSSLRGLRGDLFHLLLVYCEGEHGREHTIRLDSIPTPIDRSNLAAQGEKFRQEHKLGNAPLYAVLIGGRGAGFRYSAADIELLATGMIGLARRQQARLLVTTSRRTGRRAERQLMAALGGSCEVAYACYFNHQPQKVVASYLGAADAVFCTADSGAMLTESMTAGKPTYALLPQRPCRDAKYSSMLQWKAGSRMVKLLPIATIAEVEPAGDCHNYFRLMPRDKISEIAEKLRGIGGARAGDPA